MSRHNDGGPAFPRDSHIEAKAGLIVSQNGMSLRDYFAAATLHSITNLPSVGRYKVHQWAGDWAKWSYAVADAMLAERAKKEAQA